MAAGQIGGFPTHLRCHLVQQEVPASERTALQVVLDSDTERTALLATEAALLADGKEGASEGLVSVYEALAAIDSDGAEARAAEALDELGFTEAMQRRPTRELSGGWRMRVALAQAIYRTPDILLLDEPTNHLDLHGVMALTQFLLALDGTTCLVISHDSAFLSAITTDIIHLHLQTLTYTAGNFNTFLEARANALTNITRQQRALDAQRQHIRQSIDSMKRQVRSTGHPEQHQGLVASRQKKLGRMGLEKTADGKKFHAQSHARRVGSANDSPISTQRTRTPISLIEPPDKEFRFSFPLPDLEHFSEKAPLLSAVDLSFGYEVGEDRMEALVRETRLYAEEVERAVLSREAPPPPPTPPLESPLLFANLGLTVRAGDVMGVVGLNGLGKSSLLKLLCGEVQPSGGELRLSSGVRVGYFSQHLVDQLDVRNTPVSQLLSMSPTLASSPNSEQQARTVLGRFGLGGSLALKPIGVLSGGQKARLMFAVITMQSPHILLLDEPTNHLDLLTIDALIEAVKGFTGAVVLVSHDQALLEVCNALHLVEERRSPVVDSRNAQRTTSSASRSQRGVERERDEGDDGPSRKGKGNGSTSSISSRPSTPPPPPPPLALPSRCSMRKLHQTFDEYRERVMEAVG